MPWSERLISLRSCLRGSRKLIYETTIKQNKELAASDPEQVYDMLKARYMKFNGHQTTLMMKAKKDYQSLQKVKGMTAWQFEAAWERCLYDLSLYKLEPSAEMKFIDYLAKIGPFLSEENLKDRRNRPDGAGGMSTRPPQTWEEAHEVLAE